MSIFEIIAEETVKRFGHDDKAYKVYQDGIKHYKEAASVGYKFYVNISTDQQTVLE